MLTSKVQFWGLQLPFLGSRISNRGAAPLLPARGRRWREAPDEGRRGPPPFCVAPHPGPLPAPRGEGARLESVRIAWLDLQPVQRRVNEHGRQKGDENAVGRLEPVGLNNNGGGACRCFPGRRRRRGRPASRFRPWKSRFDEFERAAPHPDRPPRRGPGGARAEGALDGVRAGSSLE